MGVGVCMCIGESVLYKVMIMSVSLSTFTCLYIIRRTPKMVNLFRKQLKTAFQNYALIMRELSLDCVKAQSL